MAVSWLKLQPHSHIMDSMNKYLRNLGAIVLDFVETVVIAASIFLILYLTIVQPHKVNGQSMVPNFQHAEYLLTDKISYKLRDPQMGEVVVFHAPEAANCPKGSRCDFIKRILGVPGDTIEVKNNQIWVNGSPLNEVYIPDDFKTMPGAFTKDRVITLAEDEYFTVGDNREFSSDSRQWGPTPKQNIVGRAIFRYWPLSAAGVISTPSY